MSGIELFTIGSTIFTLADAATAVGLGVTAASTVGQMQAQQAAGEAAQEQANYLAKQAEIQAGQQRASSQRAAAEQRRHAAIVSSNATAAAGASGGSVADPTVQNILGDIGQEGSYRSLAMLYEGEDAARGFETQSALSRYSGAQASSAANSGAMWTGIGGFGKILSDGSSFFSKYGGGGSNIIWDRPRPMTR